MPAEKQEKMSLGSEEIKVNRTHIILLSSTFELLCGILTRVRVCFFIGRSWLSRWQVGCANGQVAYQEIGYWREGR